MKKEDMHSEIMPKMKAAVGYQTEVLVDLYFNVQVGDKMQEVCVRGDLPDGEGLEVFYGWDHKSMMD